MDASDTTGGGTTQKAVAERIGGENSAAVSTAPQDYWASLARAVEPDPQRAPGGTPGDAKQAAQLVEDLVANARVGDRASFETVCVRAFERAAHLALGFGTWPDFVKSLGLEEIANPPTTPLRAHPAANLFPMLDGAEFMALVDDIRRHGLREPIAVMPDGAILDGRNRMRACQHLGMEPTTRVYDGDDPIAFVVSLNLKRRHLGTSQRAMIAASLAQLPRGTNQHAQICAPSQREAAALMRVSVRIVQTAAKVRATGSPELVQAVERGESSVSAAVKELGVPAAARKRSLAHLAGRTPEAGSREDAAPATSTAAQPAATVGDAITAVTAALNAEDAERAREAATAALGVLERRWRGTPVDALNRSLERLQKAVTRGGQQKQLAVCVELLLCAIAGGDA